MKVVVLLVIILILLYIIFNGQSEKLFPHVSANPLPSTRIQLYDKNGELVYDDVPYRQIVKVNLKTYDINLSDETPDKIVELWNMDEMSDAAGFYNPYTESTFATRANPAKYQLIDRIYGGQHVNKYPPFPVKKIFIKTSFAH